MRQVARHIELTEDVLRGSLWPAQKPCPGDPLAVAASQLDGGRVRKRPRPAGAAARRMERPGAGPYQHHSEQVGDAHQRRPIAFPDERRLLCPAWVKRTVGAGARTTERRSWWGGGVILKGSAAVVLRMGYGGQLIQVIPDLDLVVVITSDADQGRRNAADLGGGASSAEAPPSGAEVLTKRAQAGHIYARSAPVARRSAGRRCWARRQLRPRPGPRVPGTPRSGAPPHPSPPARRVTGGDAMTAAPADPAAPVAWPLLWST